MKSPVCVKRCSVAFSPVISSENPVTVATTSPLVNVLTSYAILAVGSHFFSTVIILVTGVAAFPAASLTLYVPVYVPTTAVLSGFTNTILFVMFPSTASLAVAHESTYICP